MTDKNLNTKDNINISPSDWVKTTLGEVCEIKSGSTPSTKEESFWNGEISWITPKDLSNYNYVYISKGEKSITQKGLKSSSVQLLPRNTILFSSRAPIGYVAIAQNELTTNQGFKNLVCDEKRSHFRFFYYLLKEKSDHIEKLSSGSTFSEASASVMRSIQISLPSLLEQQVIASVLSAFDDKIELLREENKTLEEIGKTIFKEWFGKYSVDKPEELPEGWRVGKLGEELTIKQGKYVKAENLSEDKTEVKKYPIYGANGIRGYIDNYMYEEPKVVFGCRGLCGNPRISEKQSSITNTCMVLENEKSFLSSEFIYFLSKKIDFESVTSGSAQPQITITNLYSLEIIIPDQETLKQFDEAIQPIFRKIRDNSEQIQSLSHSRDELLPKLMSGVVRVNDFNKN